MRPVQDLWGQLVEKKLWPIALVLVAALVAVPLVLAKSPAPDSGQSAGGGPPVAATAADLRTSDEAVVSVAEEQIEGVRLRGRVKDPFKQQHVPAQPSAEGGSGPIGQPGAGSTTGGGDGSGDSGGGTGGDGGTGDDAPETFTYASIDVAFGRAGTPLREIRNVPRLTPLPNASNPIVIFLGMRGDHETAVFMLSSDVHAQGDGRCVPSVKLCESIELRQDDVVFLDVRSADGSVVQYELSVVVVELHETTSKQQAKRSQARAARSRLWLERVRGPREPRRAVPRASAGAAPQVPVLTPLP